LEHLQAHSYQMLAQLSAVKSMLVLRLDRLTPAEIEGPLAQAAAHIEHAIGSAPTTGPIVADGSMASVMGGPIPLPDPFDNDISPWLLRRLDLAVGIADQLRDDAARILQSLSDPAAQPTTR
ncbi:MAG: FUSC family protein, partial [Gammaproteobacteria bacterium]|nr:FUSC family protein [Gammaproteobacteria bacterium]